MSDYDLIIHNALIVDGTGKDAYTGDIAVKDGHIAALGDVTGSAERIGERFRRGNPLVAIETEVDPMRSAIEETFLAFYPELQAFVSDWRRQ